MAKKLPKRPSGFTQVRFVPAMCGSPGWMSLYAASVEYWREMDLIDLLAQCKAAPKSLPCIEYEGKPVTPEPRHLLAMR